MLPPLLALSLCLLLASHLWRSYKRRKVLRTYQRSVLLNWPRRPSRRSSALTPGLAAKRWPWPGASQPIEPGQSVRTARMSVYSRRMSFTGGALVQLRKRTPTISYLYPKSMSRWRMQSGEIRDGRPGRAGRE